jgi:hypothetical protein
MTPPEIRTGPFGITVVGPGGGGMLTTPDVGDAGGVCPIAKGVAAPTPKSTHPTNAIRLTCTLLDNAVSLTRLKPSVKPQRCSAISACPRPTLFAIFRSTGSIAIVIAGIATTAKIAHTTSACHSHLHSSRVVCHG